MAVLAPMPSPSAITPTAVKAGVFLSIRAAYFKSCVRALTFYSGLPSCTVGCRGGFADGTSRCSGGCPIVGLVKDPKLDNLRKQPRQHGFVPESVWLPRCKEQLGLVGPGHCFYHRPVSVFRRAVASDLPGACLRNFWCSWKLLLRLRLPARDDL